jgi:hypothetical protein
MLEKRGNLLEEQKSFEDEVTKIEEWWKTPRQADIKRPWTAKTIASLRNTVPLPCLVNSSAIKLWDLLHENRSRGTTELSFGATDPVAVSQMAKYMRTVYVSGGLSGFSENNYPGMDHADYVSKHLNPYLLSWVIEKIKKMRCELEVLIADLNSHGILYPKWLKRSSRLNNGMTRDNANSECSTQ